MSKRPSSRRFWSNERAVGAIEFAIVFPVLLLLFLGGSELGIALTVDRKVKAAAGYATDLVSQSTELTDPDLRKLFGIAKGTLPPYSIAPLQMRVTQVKIDKKGNATVDWSCQTDGYDALAPGTNVSVPVQLTTNARQVWGDIADRILQDHGLDHDVDLDHANKLDGNVPDGNVYVIWGQSKYRFAPITGAAIGQTVSLSGETYLLPRYSTEVASTGCAPFKL